MLCRILSSCFIKGKRREEIEDLIAENYGEGEGAIYVWCIEEMLKISRRDHELVLDVISSLGYEIVNGKEGEIVLGVRSLIDS